MERPQEEPSGSPSPLGGSTPPRCRVAEQGEGEADYPLLWAIELLLARVGTASNWSAPAHAPLSTVLACLRQLVPSRVVTRTAGDGLLHRLNVLGLLSWFQNRDPGEWPRATSRAFAALVAASPASIRLSGYGLLDLARCHMAVAPLREVPPNWDGFAAAMADESLWASVVSGSFGGGDDENDRRVPGEGRAQLEQLLAVVEDPHATEDARRRRREGALALVAAAYSLDDFRGQLEEYMGAFEKMLPPPFLDQMALDIQSGAYLAAGTTAATTNPTRREHGSESIDDLTPTGLLDSEKDHVVAVSISDDGSDDVEEEEEEAAAGQDEQEEEERQEREDSWEDAQKPQGGGGGNPEALATVAGDANGGGDKPQNRRKAVAGQNGVPTQATDGAGEHLSDCQEKGEEEQEEQKGKQEDEEGEGEEQEEKGGEGEEEEASEVVGKDGEPWTRREAPPDKRRRSDGSAQPTAAAKRRRLIGDEISVDTTKPRWHRRRSTGTTTTTVIPPAAAAAAAAAAIPSSGRRQRRRWTGDEVSHLLAGVKRFGLGNWKRIVEHYGFDGRTAVDLKDKYRNLEREWERKAPRPTAAVLASRRRPSPDANTSLDDDIEASSSTPSKTTTGRGAAKQSSAKRRPHLDFIMTRGGIGEHNSDDSD